MFESEPGCVRELVNAAVSGLAPFDSIHSPDRAVLEPVDRMANAMRLTSVHRGTVVATVLLP